MTPENGVIIQPIFVLRESHIPVTGDTPACSTEMKFSDLATCGERVKNRILPRSYTLKCIEDK